jgi:hypothetical protein
LRWKDHFQKKEQFKSISLAALHWPSAFSTFIYNNCPWYIMEVHSTLFSILVEKNQMEVRKERMQQCGLHNRPAWLSLFDVLPYQLDCCLPFILS